MKELYDLPNEILYSVIKTFEGDGYKTILALCLTSRRLREVALPSLYGVVKLVAEPRYAAFATILTTNPSLGTYVQVLDAEHFYQMGSSLHETPIPMIDLVEFMPNLVEAHFRAYHTTILSIRNNYASGSLAAGLRSLRVLYLSWATNWGNPVECITTSLTMLPALRTLIFTRADFTVNKEAVAFPENDDIHGTSDVENLTLRCWDGFSDSTLIHILRIPKSLKRFRFSQSWPSSQHVAPSAILRGLEFSRDTLQELTLGNMPLYDREGFTSFAGLHVLRSLEAPIGLVVSVLERKMIPLPESLQSLHVYPSSPSPDAYARWDAIVHMLRNRPSASFKHLRLTGLQANFEAESRVHLAGKGVEVVIVHADDDCDD